MQLLKEMFFFKSNYQPHAVPILALRAVRTCFMQNCPCRHFVATKCCFRNSCYLVLQHTRHNPLHIRHNPLHICHNPLHICHNQFLACYQMSWWKSTGTFHCTAASGSEITNYFIALRRVSDRMDTTSDCCVYEFIAGNLPDIKLKTTAEMQKDVFSDLVKLAGGLKKKKKKGKKKKKKVNVEFPGKRFFSNDFLVECVFMTRFICTRVRLHSFAFSVTTVPFASECLVADVIGSMSPFEKMIVFLLLSFTTGT